MNKKSFYCWYLGFTEISKADSSDVGKITELVSDLMKYHEREKEKCLSTTTTTTTTSNSSTVATQVSKCVSKVTLVLSKSSVNIIDVEVHVKKKLFQKSSQKIVNKTYAIGYENLVNVFYLKGYQDVVSLLTKSANQNRKKPDALYFHAFRFDSDESAYKMEMYLNKFRANFLTQPPSPSSQPMTKFTRIPRYDDDVRAHQSSSSPIPPPFDLNEHLFNKNLKNRNDLVRNLPSQYSDPMNSSTNSSSSYEAVPNSPVDVLASPPSPLHVVINRSPLHDNITREIREKFSSGQPILFPPKDYTKLDRLRGNLEEAELRRSQHPFIVGEEALKTRDTVKPTKTQQPPPTEDSIEHETSSSEETSSAANEQQMSIDEQTYEALKLLDDVVNSELNNQQQELENLQERAGLVYEFKPPAPTDFYMSSNDIYSSGQPVTTPAVKMPATEKNKIRIIKRPESVPDDDDGNDDNCILGSALPFHNVTSRANPLQRLGTYQPQWLPNGPTIQSTKSDLKSARNASTNNNKNSESFRSSLIDDGKPPVCTTDESVGGGKFILGLFRKGLPRVSRFPSQREPPPDYGEENSEFILRPCAAGYFNSYDSSQQQQQQSKRNTGRSSSAAKANSKSEMSLKNISNRYHDVYY
jgi:hypothetical protein